MKLNLKSHAKINLALNVTGKNKSLHKIESIISFIDLHDVISIKKIRGEKHNIFFQAEDGIRDVLGSRGLGDVYKRQTSCVTYKT